MDKMFSETDIRAIVGNVKFFHFSDLTKYKKIEQILPKSRECCVIFFETESKYTGHWTSLCRNVNEYTFFDSYGNSENSDYQYIPHPLKEKLNINKDYLRELLKGKKLIQNHIDFQSWKEGINTCGRFVSMFLYLWKKGYNLESFQKVMKENKKKYGYESYDAMAVAFT